MAIGDDFTFDYVNRRVSHTSGTTVYTSQELYTHMQETFDDATQMDDPVAMSAQTPTAFTMINNWWLNISPGSEAHKYLRGGAIQTSGYDATTYNDGIRLLKFASGGYTSAVAGDIGREVGYSGGTPTDTGTLLGYDNTLRYWWVRVDDTGDVFSNTATAMDLDDGTGTGAGTLTAASTTGEEIYSRLYTLGTIAATPNAQVYIFQNGSVISEWSSLTNWDRGHIDVLIQVTEMGTDIDSKQVTVYNRQQGDTFDHFPITLTTAGQDAVPLSTSIDLDNTTGDYYLFYDAESTAFTTAGQIITGGTSAATAEFVSATDWGTSGVLTLRGVNGTFQDNETITGSTEGSATVNGTVGDTYGSYDAETAGFIAGDIGKVIVGGTSGAKRILRAYQDDGTSGKYLGQVDSSETGTDRVAQYKAFADNDNITVETGTGDVTSDAASTTVVSGWSDITIAFVNGTCTHGGTTGTFTNGEVVTWNDGSAQSGIVLLDSGSALTLGNCTSTSLNTYLVTGDQSGATCTPSQDLQSAHTMNKAFEQQSNNPYDIIVQCGDLYEAGRTVAQVYEYFKFVCQANSAFQMYTVVSGVITQLDGEEYIQAYTGYSPKKPSPLGTFAGGTLFGAQGVWLEGYDSGSAAAFSLIDANGTVQDPPTSVIVNITSVVADDRVTVFRTVSGTTIDKDLYQSHATNNSAGDATLETDGSPAISQDTPASGVIRIVDASENTEHRMRYTSWTGSTFTLVTAVTGSTTSVGGSTSLNDTGTTFTSEDILHGDIVRNTTDGSWAHVISVATNVVTTSPLQGGSDNTWDNGDGYSFHTLPVTYTSSDTIYTPFIDGTATTTNISSTFLYAADRSVLIRVRKKGIDPFQTTGTVTSAGLTVAAIRNTDSIVT